MMAILWPKYLERPVYLAIDPPQSHVSVFKMANILSSRMQPRGNMAIQEPRESLDAFSTVGLAIREARRAAGLSQRQLGMHWD